MQNAQTQIEFSPDEYVMMKSYRANKKILMIRALSSSCCSHHPSEAPNSKPTSVAEQGWLNHIRPPRKRYGWSQNSPSVVLITQAKHQTLNQPLSPNKSCGLQPNEKKNSWDRLHDSWGKVISVFDIPASAMYVPVCRYAERYPIIPKSRKL
jgi:hypothetical protein